jgi:hypothetical protein
VRPANDNFPLKPGDFDLFSGLLSERNAVGGTHNSGKMYFVLALILVTKSGMIHVGLWEEISRRVKKTY